MSGSGSNLRKIIESKAHGSSYTVVCILTDNPASNAKVIASEYGIPYEENDIAAFYAKKGKPRKDLSLRPEFDAITITLLKKHKPDVVAYCGYMSIASPVLANTFLGINVHPADLSILDAKGLRKYRGGHAVRDAILAGENAIRSTTHIVEETVDGGRLLMRSKPVKVVLPKGFNPLNPSQLEAAEKENQNRLKEKGDWVIFPKTLEFIAEGRFTQDKSGKIHFNGKAALKGVEPA